jgi:hypothetical protein
MEIERKFPGDFERRKEKDGDGRNKQLKGICRKDLVRKYRAISRLQHIIVQATEG